MLVQIENGERGKNASERRGREGGKEESKEVKTVNSCKLK